MDGFFQDNPRPDALEFMPDKYKVMASNVDLHSLETHQHRGRFDLKTSETQRYEFGGRKNCRHV